MVWRGLWICFGSEDIVKLIELGLGSGGAATFYVGRKAHAVAVQHAAPDLQRAAAWMELFIR